MLLDESLAPLIPPLHEVIKWLRGSGVSHVVVGGVAAALQGRPRATRDIDLVVMIGEDEWASFLADATAHGFPPRETNALEFASISRVLLLQHERTRLGVDISLGAIPFEEEMIARAKGMFVEGIDVPLATPEDLIVMKSLAMRPNDITDIESLLDAHPEMDLDRVRHWVRLFAEGLEEPDIVERIERVLRSRGT